MAPPGVSDSCRGQCAVQKLTLRQAAIFQNRKNRYAAARVVSHQNKFSRLVDSDVAGIGSAGCNLIQQRQFAGRAIDGESADRTTLLALVIADFIYCKQKSMIGMHGEERGINGLRRQADGCDLRAARIVTIGVDALAGAAILSVGANVHEIRIFVLGWRGVFVGRAYEARKRQRNEQEENRHDCAERKLTGFHIFVGAFDRYLATIAFTSSKPQAQFGRTAERSH